MRVKFKNGYTVIDGIETSIPEERWREMHENAKIHRNALNIGMKVLTDPKLREKLKDLVEMEEADPVIFES
jgi:hypothetical protein